MNRIFSRQRKCFSKSLRFENNDKPGLGGLSEGTFKFLAEKSLFTRTVLQVKILSSSAGMMTMKVPYTPANIGDSVRSPCLHNGILAATIDHVGGFSAWTLLSTTNQFLATVDLRVDFLSPAPLEDIICDAHVAHKGDKFVRADIVCWNADRSIKLAIGRALYNIYQSPLTKGGPIKRFVQDAREHASDDTARIGVKIWEKFMFLKQFSMARYTRSQKIIRPRLPHHVESHSRYVISGSHPSDSLANHPHNLMHHSLHQVKVASLRIANIM